MKVAQSDAGANSKRRLAQKQFEGDCDVDCHKRAKHPLGEVDVTCEFLTEQSDVVLEIRFVGLGRDDEIAFQYREGIGKGDSPSKNLGEDF